jgi:HlyD family secretion protein
MIEKGREERPAGAGEVQAPAFAPGRRGSRRRKAAWLGLLLVAGVAGLVWRGALRSSEVEGILTLSGRIEGDDAAVGARAGGRILSVVVHEGDTVNAGDPMAVLDDDQVRARLDQARAALVQVEARATASRNQVAVLEQQLRQAELQTEQARVDAEARVRQAEADVAAAEAQLAREQAALQIAEFDREAYMRLAESGAVSQRQGRQAASVAGQQAAAVTAAERRVEAARAGLATARANLTTPDIRAAQAATIVRQIAQQQAEVASANAEIERSRAQVSEAEANRDDLTVKAPFAGTVVTRIAEPGEVVMAGTPVATLVDLSKVYLRGFIPEGRIGQVKVGQPARVYLDSSPDEPIEAYVSRIDPEATFTPENTYFREDRVKQVVGVKVMLKGATGFAKPGMPADGEILVGGQWTSARRQ